MRLLADALGISRVRLPLEPPRPEVPAGHHVVFLLDASTELETQLLAGWIRRIAPDADVLHIESSRIRRRRRTDLRLASRVRDDPAAWFVPLRVVWMPAERKGRRTVSWVDLLKLGDPRDPRWLRDYLILTLFPDRVRIVVGEGASGSSLVEAHAGDHRPLDAFVTRRAWLALDRAERAERGDRYKIPRFLAEDILGDPTFQGRVVELGGRRGLSPRRALARGRYYLREIAATHSPFLIDLIANLIHWVIRKGYGAIHYDPRSIREVAQLGRDHPLVFLPSHKSNFDRLSLQFVLWENDLPPNHTAGGINMNFFPVGPLVRRTGVFFIRRSFKGNDLYKFVLTSYIDYLVERRFPLEWYMEGGRSRTGKLRPPRYGLLSWVVEALKRRRADDVYLIPVSIAYDHIHEVGAYVAEATGGTKEKESFGWALKFYRGLRRRYGDIHIRFAEPVSVAQSIGGGDELDVQKLAFEVMHRISMATPVTPTALVATVMLAGRGAARDLPSIAGDCRQLVRYISERGLPTTVSSLPRDEAEVAATLALMIDHKLVTRLQVGKRVVYWMNAEQMLRSSYYSNTVVHYFVPRGIAEVALRARDLDGFWEDVWALRDLLKFEFYFAAKEEFEKALVDELDAEVPDWRERIGTGRPVQLSPSVVDFALLPFLEAYQVVADQLVATEGTPEEKPFLSACLDRGTLYRLEQRIFCDEGVSQALYEGAVLLVRNRDLWDDSEGVAERRQEFAREVERLRLTAYAPGMADDLSALRP
jgi:glycerol-3-phosphate O-acyltransferase